MVRHVYQRPCIGDASAYVEPFACAAINEVRVKGDSCGGEVTCVVRNCPKGLGAPVFDKLEAELAKAMMSLPASKVGIRVVLKRTIPLATKKGRPCLEYD
jgi:chorismate synthase